MNENGIGYPIYRMNEIHDMMCDFSVEKYADISESELETFLLNDKDVVFNRTNSFEWVGRTGIYRKFSEEKFVFASYLVRFIPNEKIILPEYLTTYLNSKYGQWDIKRRARQSINQANVNPEEIKAMEIPLLDMRIQKQIEFNFDEAYKRNIKSESLYKEAEKILLKELDLLNFEPSKKKVSIKTFNESFGNTGRLDSEYYQPKYEDIIKKIKDKSYDNLKNIVKITKSIEPGSDSYQDTGIPFVRVSNLSKEGISNPSIHLSKMIFKEGQLQELQPKKNTILLSKDGSIGIAYNVKDKLNVVTSGAIIHLTIYNEKVLPEYLTLVLNSLIVKMQSERDAGGSIIKHWKPSEIAEILIPIIDKGIQTKIEKKIKESFQLKKESKELLEKAKRAVEIAIEENEEKAINFINQG